jgi:phosphopantetheinyl transferase
MPISLKEQNQDCIFGLWTITETHEELLRAFKSVPDEEVERLVKFKNPNRQIERIVTRLLIYELLGKQVIIDYDENGKPLLRDDKRQISISHTSGMVAVVIGNKFAGVDVEKISGRVAKIAHKFLSPTELDSIDISNQMLHMYAFWSAKETIYKIYGRKKLDFKDNIKIEAFDIKDKGTIKANLQTDESELFELDYFIYDVDDKNKYMLVKCCG